MGACTFYTEQEGPNAKAAFEDAVDQAQYDYGHAGYTGTIAEKGDFVMISLPEGKDPYDYADELIANGDRRIDDKWGPAGCIKMEEGKYLFFGWASS